MITAVLLGVLFKRKALHYMPLGGMLFLAAGIAVFRSQVPPDQSTTLIGSGLTGIGLGATVAPGAVRCGVLTALGEPAARLRDRGAAAGRRGVHDRADLRPLRADHGKASTRDRSGPVDRAGDSRSPETALGVAVYALGGARPQNPDLDSFLDGEAPAWYSPPFSQSFAVCPGPSAGE